LTQTNIPQADVPANSAPAVVPKGEKGYNAYLLKRCLRYFAPYKLKILLAILGMIAAAAADGTIAYLVKPAMDDVFIRRDETALIVIPLAFLAVLFIKAGGRLTQNYMMQSCGLLVLERLRDELYNKIIKMPVAFYERAQVGMLMSRVINDVGTIRDSLPAIIMIVRQVLIMAALLVVVYKQNWQLAIFSTIVLPLAFFPFFYFGRRLRKLGRKSQSVLAGASVVLQEIFSGIRIIKAFATEKKEGERFSKENRNILKIALKRALAGEFSSASMEMVIAVGTALVFYFGASKVLSGEMTQGEFFSFVTGLAMIYEPVRKLNTANNSIQGALAGAERVFEVLDSDAYIPESGGQLELKDSFEELRFENVTFGYSERSPALLNINLTLRKGERLALVGPSGAGKSTFVSLLPRFYDPGSGCVTLNGVDLRAYTLPSLRTSMSIVSQDNFLFNCSVYDNIAYGQKKPDAEDPQALREQVMSAARAAYAHDFIMEMPEGYATVIGERGVKLSGGQKQRITIARAIAKNAPLLILDEATSALDSESEKIVQRALENLMQGRTSIIIAHRLSTVLSSDRILVMDKGEIAAEGTHAQLIAASPLYARLYRMQFGAQEGASQNLQG
jgi:subfamily B ATP-binding cassette protein MsbA